jgi:long-chain acyl-CoA synthetase
MNTAPQIIRDVCARYPDLTAQYHRNGDDKIVTTDFKTFYLEYCRLAAGLHKLGVGQKDLVGLISENRKEWLIADMGVMALGAADVPRGCDSTDQELEYILGVTECRVVFAEKDKELKRLMTLKEKLPAMKELIIMDPYWKGEAGKQGKIMIRRFDEVLALGAEVLAAEPKFIENRIAEGLPEDLATIIFTSGTTGKPKGVMLNQRAFTNQIVNVPQRLNLKPGDIMLSVLPVWHSFERAIQYLALGRGTGLAYSKPVGAIMLRDFGEIQPSYLPSVPRIWEALRGSVLKKINAAGGLKKALFYFFLKISSHYAFYRQMVLGLLPRFHRRSRVIDALLGIWPLAALSPLKGLGYLLVFSKLKKVFGKRFKAGISGGGALQKDVDGFFQAAGINLVEGYGLTESAPILGVRREWAPEVGTVGLPWPGMTIEIRDEEGKVLGPGHRGIIFAKGPQIMDGYYKDPEATAKVVSPDGWLNTGDLGMMTFDGSYKIMGRVKDTIVLLGGENIEPVPIEHRLKLSPYIEHVVVLGQDKKYLAALIIPSFELLDEYAKEHNLYSTDRESLVATPEIFEMFREIIVDEISARNGFKSFEQIYRFKILPVTFELNRELSAKQELKRHVINDLYKKEIGELFK